MPRRGDRTPNQAEHAEAIQTYRREDLLVCTVPPPRAWERAPEPLVIPEA